MNGVMGMSRIEELEKQITELDEQKVALQHELEVEKQKKEFDYPFNYRETCYLLSSNSVIVEDWWSSSGSDRNCYRQGNFFKTKEEAQRERDKRELLTRFRQFRDKCNGDWKPDWKSEGNGGEYYNIDLTYNGGKAELGIDWNRHFHPFCLFGYFKEQEDVERAIELFGDEIKRLFVED